MYKVTLTDHDGHTTTHTWTWARCLAYLPGGKLYGSVAVIEVRRIVP
jgi:hypothetical protein